MFAEKFPAHKINPEATVRNTKWIVVCPNCQHEREVTYPQVNNISLGKNRQECVDCQVELGLYIRKNPPVNYKGSEIQEKARIARTGIQRPSSKKVQEYLHLFGDQVVKEETKEKMRNAKLGKFGKLAVNYKHGMANTKEYPKFKLEQLKKDPKRYKEYKIKQNIKHNSIRSKFKKQMPKWLSSEQKQEIKNYYIACQILNNLSNKKYEVDHILPINGKTISGLHVPWNLQLLEEIENIKKGNKIEGLC